MKGIVLSKRLHLAASTLPLWQRMLASLCLLLVFGSMTAQAAHVHGDWLPHKDIQLHQQPSLAPTTEADCPFCAAVHLALPLGSGPTIAILQIVEGAPAFAPNPWHPAERHFASFSRPPPRQSRSLAGSFPRL